MIRVKCLYMVYTYWITYESSKKTEHVTSVMDIVRYSTRYIFKKKEK